MKAAQLASYLDFNIPAEFREALSVRTSNHERADASGRLEPSGL